MTELTADDRAFDAPVRSVPAADVTGQKRLIQAIRLGPIAIALRLL